MSNFFIFVALLVVISPQVLGKSKDYCSSVFRKICENKGEHVGCRPKDFSDYPSCSNQHPKLIRMKSSYKKYILKRHNELRNKLASGTMTSTHGTFPSAMNMSELKWDSELEKLAEYNVKQCTMNHDRCRSTDSSISFKTNFMMPVRISTTRRGHRKDQVIKQILLKKQSKPGGMNIKIFTSTK
ncbi:AAEL003053-PA [Aedes aegypti]|uniref:AAEL003053-PA n=1 Tax=Aedes aegypti TaxID=7159 RepID=Q0IG84_AEDAE|nr:AAEL003053-PA [Aedes aegypti]